MLVTVGSLEGSEPALPPPPPYQVPPDLQLGLVEVTSPASPRRARQPSSPPPPPSPPSCPPPGTPASSPMPSGTLFSSPPRPRLGQFAFQPWVILNLSFVFSVKYVCIVYICICLYLFCANICMYIFTRLGIWICICIKSVYIFMRYLYSF